MIKNAGNAVKKFMLTSGEDIYNDEHYDDDDVEYVHEEDPMRDHYSRRPPERQPRQPRSDYSDKIVSMGYSSQPPVQPGYNQSRFQSNSSFQNYQSSSKPMIIPSAVVAHPKEFKDASRICDDILGGKLVIVDLSSLDSAMAQRIADYLGGVVHTVQGHTKRVNKGIFIVSPRDYEITAPNNEDVREYGTLKAVADRY